jgi:hypothetical protein
MSKQKAKPGTKTVKSVPKKAAKPDERLTIVHAISVYIEEKMNQFIAAEDLETTLSPAERRRLIGAGVKNYGLIDKTFDIARDNPQFLPPFLTVEQMWHDMQDFEEIRHLVAILEQFLSVANECMLIQGDKCFRDALRIYDSLKEQSRNRVPGAKALYEMLLSFFKKRRRPGEAEPTEKELERDFHALLHGRADGEIIIKNERPVVTGRKREVIDAVKRGKVTAKETVNVKEEK